MHLKIQAGYDMADDITQLLQALLASKETEAAIAANNPWLQFSTPISQVSSEIWKGVAPGDSDSLRDAALISGISGLLGGVLQGFGQDYQATLRDRYNQAVTTELPVEGLPADLWQRAETGRMIRQSLQAQEAKDFQKEIAKTYLIEGIKGDIKKEIEGAKKGDWFSRLNVSSKQQAYQAGAVTDQLAKLGETFRQANLNPLEMAAAKTVPQHPFYNDVQQVKLLIPQVVRLAGDVGNLAEQEQARAYQAMLGNTAAGSKEIGELLLGSAELFRGIALRRLETARTGLEQGGDVLLERLSTPVGAGGLFTPAAPAAAPAALPAAPASYSAKEIEAARAELQRRGVIK